LSSTVRTAFFGPVQLCARLVIYQSAALEVGETLLAALSREIDDSWITAFVEHTILKFPLKNRGDRNLQAAQPEDN
jgi:hypothetical protein